MEHKTTAVILAFLSAILMINIVLAQTIYFDINLMGSDEDFKFEYYNDGQINIPYLDFFFTNFSAEFLQAEMSGEQIFSGREDYGRYLFTGRILDSSGNILAEQDVSDSFYILSNPPTELNETIISFSFNDNPKASILQVWYNDTLLLEQEFRSLLCNSNNICENIYTENYNMFENYLSCPSDCSYFSKDGICNTAPTSDYSFNDYYCDEDCWFDIDAEDNESGECFKANCNDGIQNQDEAGVDCGGVCGGSCGECTDADSFMSGSSSLFNASYVEMNGQFFFDSCVDDRYVREYTCSSKYIWPFSIWFGQEVGESVIYCNDGCVNGACVR